MALFFLLSYVFGAASNYARTSAGMGGTVKLTFATLSLVVLLAWLVFFTWSLVRGRCSGEDLGFVLGIRPAIVLTALVAIFAGVLFIRFPAPPLAALQLVQVVAAVLVEELLVRPVLINLLRKTLVGSRVPLRLAVVVAAAIWALAHVPSKPLSQVVGIFIAGLVFNALYAFSGSNVVGYVVHASANGGGVGAIAMFGLYLLVAFVTRRSARFRADAATNSGRR